jgi:hypothetical protein
VGRRLARILCLFNVVRPSRAHHDHLKLPLG